MYVRRRNSDIWHWCINCHNWPARADRADARDSAPNLERELCGECFVKQRDNRCESLSKVGPTHSK